MDKDALEPRERYPEALFDARRDLVNLDDRKPFAERAVQRRMEFGSVAPDGDLVTARRPRDLVRHIPDGFNEPGFLRRDIASVADSGSPGLDVRVDHADPRLIGPEVLFDVRGHFVGLLEGKVVIDFEMEIHVELASVFMDADVVHRHLVPLRDGADPRRDGLSFPLSRIGVNDHVGVGRDALDPGLHLDRDVVSPFQGQVPIDLHADVDELPGPGTADTDLADPDHAADGGGSFGDRYGWYVAAVRNRISANWFKLGFPSGYMADVLQNLEVLVELGHKRDKCLRPAIEWLLAQQNAQGRWKNQHSYSGTLWVGIESQGSVSKWVTLRACRVLKATA